jgi:hypothetical protein
MYPDCIVAACVSASLLLQIPFSDLLRNLDNLTQTPRIRIHDAMKFPAFHLL